MPTPVGPAPRDPDDPDFWDWSDEVWEADADIVAPTRRRPVVVVVAAVLVVALIVLYVASQFV